MGNRNSGIKGSQFVFLTAGFVYGSFLLLAFLTKSAQHNVWFVFLSGSVTSIPLILCFSALGKLFPDKNLVEILESVYGLITGKFVIFIYFMYFMLLLSFNLYDLSSFYSGLVMPDTPFNAFSAVFTILCAYAAAKGMEVVSKIGFLVAIVAMFTAVTTTLLLIGNMDFERLLPLVDIPMDAYLKTTSIVVAVPFGELVAMLFVFPQLKDKKKASRYMLTGTAIITVIFLIITVRNLVTLGRSSEVYSQSAYQSVRMINIGDFITRIELVIAIAITTGLFIKISVLYYATVKSISQLFSLKSYKSLILPVGSIAFVVSVISFPSSVSHADWGEKYSAVFSLPCNILLPVLTLVVAKLRGLPGKGAGSQSPKPVGKECPESRNEPTL